MKKCLLIDIQEGSYDKQFECTILLNGSLSDILLCAQEAMYKVNEQINATKPEDMPKNIFWTTLVATMGERLLEESKR